MEIRKHPFEDDQEKKDRALTAELKSLTEYHRKHCRPYADMLSALDYDPDRVSHYSQLPFLPVTLFKKMKLSSLAEDADYKVVTSSGTSGQQKSMIVLDSETRSMQQMVLASIGTDFLGGGRMPMLVIDCPKTVKDRNFFSARTSGIRGFSLFGSRTCYALKDEDMSLDWEGIHSFLERWQGKKIFVFGFTWLVWKYFVLALEEAQQTIDLSGACLVHGGGWKKLQDLAVAKEEFKCRIQAVTGITEVMDYYGMAEQTGSIFMECSCGHLHCSDYSGILFRRPADFSLCDVGERGLIQVLSVIPKSYPGHNLLTEDEGALLGVDDCPCGRKGPYFEVYGRTKNAELRGCSNTFEG